jgi:hypothetical protein
MRRATVVFDCRNGAHDILVIWRIIKNTTDTKEDGAWFGDLGGWMNKWNLETYQKLYTMTKSFLSIHGNFSSERCVT